MKRVLFFPLLRIPSGHHQVAEALVETIKTIDPSVDCRSIELLSFSYGKVESFISKAYLYWIHHFPTIYSAMYRWNAGAYNIVKQKRYTNYQLLFASHMLKILQKYQPDLMICTHALPSYILNYIKEAYKVTVPIINVYTDYFINNIWGLTQVDYHFVPDNLLKEELVRRGVAVEKIFVTGIPIHPKIKVEKEQEIPKTELKQVLITGGSLGCGKMNRLISKIEKEDSFRWVILCGKNNKLYNELTNNKYGSHIKPLQYITEKEKIANIYKSADAIITKPGGVTLSESLYNKVPVFIYHSLPGQEEMNVHHLSKLKLINKLNMNSSIRGQLEQFFQNEMGNYYQRLGEYLNTQYDNDYYTILKKFIS